MANSSKTQQNNGNNSLKSDIAQTSQTCETSQTSQTCETLQGNSQTLQEFKKDLKELLNKRLETNQVNFKPFMRKYFKSTYLDQVFPIYAFKRFLKIKNITDSKYENFLNFDETPYKDFIKEEFYLGKIYNLIEEISNDLSLESIENEFTKGFNTF